MSAEPRRPRRAWLWFLGGIGATLLAVVLLGALRAVLDRQENSPGAVATGTPAVRLRVSDARLLSGTNFVRVDIGTGYDSGSSYGSSSGPMQQRNLILLDRTSGAARRLLPDNSRAIRQAWFLPAEADRAGVTTDEMDRSDEDQPPAYFVLLVAQAEQSARFDLLVGSLAGQEQGFVMQGIEGVDAIWMQTSTQIGLLVREQQVLIFRVVDIPTLRVVRQHRVAI